MHKSQSLFNLTTALDVSGVTLTHLQEHKTTVTTASGTVTSYCCLLLPWKSSKCTTIAVGSNNGVTNTRCCSYSCFVLLMMGDSDARNM